MIAMYDIEDNFIKIFDNYKQCAEYFETTTKVIHSCVSEIKSGHRDRKRDKKNKCWVKLYKIEDDD